MHRVIIAGAAGRMGRRLIANCMEHPDFEIAGALEYAESPFLGQDAGAVAGCGEAGVKISADLAPLLKNADAIIDFATGGVMECVEQAVKANIAVVLGSTALKPEERARLAELGKSGRIVSASNMSVGVNLLFKLAAETAKILGEEYDIEVVEMHHNRKQDAPSGTAVTLAEKLCEARGFDYDRDVRHGRVGMVGARTKHEIGMHSLRGGDVVGDHTVIFAVDGERIELTHKASSRDTFARGALRAVEFLSDASAGLYDMQQVLGLK